MIIMTVTTNQMKFIAYLLLSPVEVSNVTMDSALIHPINVMAVMTVTTVQMKIIAHLQIVKVSNVAMDNALIHSIYVMAVMTVTTIQMKLIAHVQMGLLEDAANQAHMADQAHFGVLWSSKIPNEIG